jgi:hypothetical protein
LTLHRAGKAANLLEMCPTGSKGLHFCNCPRQDPRDPELCTLNKADHRQGHGYYEPSSTTLDPRNILPRDVAHRAGPCTAARQPKCTGTSQYAGTLPRRPSGMGGSAWVVNKKEPLER